LCGCDLAIPQRREVHEGATVKRGRWREMALHLVQPWVVDPSGNLVQRFQPVR
jgi:hypothetical protein